MLVIDKHAAHERVIFEDLKRITERDGRVASQALLLPITVLLSPDEIAYAEEFKDEISSLGLISSLAQIMQILWLFRLPSVAWKPRRSLSRWLTI